MRGYCKLHLVSHDRSVHHSALIGTNIYHPSIGSEMKADTQVGVSVRQI
jgi:hypothetical protein